MITGSNEDYYYPKEYVNKLWYISLFLVLVMTKKYLIQ
jgi:hypothetical protein